MFTNSSWTWLIAPDLVYKQLLDLANSSRLGLQSLRHGKPCHLPLHKGGLNITFHLGKKHHSAERQNFTPSYGRNFTPKAFHFSPTGEKFHSAEGRIPHGANISLHTLCGISLPKGISQISQGIYIAACSPLGITRICSLIHRFGQRSCPQRRPVPPRQSPRMRCA